MDSQILAASSLILLIFASVIMIIISDWKIRLGLLAIIYFCELIIVSLNWPVSLAVIKLVAGWMTAAILGMALLGNQPAEQVSTNAENLPHSSRINVLRILRIKPVTTFYLLSSIIVILFTFSIAGIFMSWIPDILETVLLSGLLLLGMGILQLGFHPDVFSSILGLLLMVVGFEIIYSSVERSTLVAGLLAGITLGLALVGAYLLISPQIEENE